MRLAADYYNAKRKFLRRATAKIVRYAVAKVGGQRHAAPLRLQCFAEFNREIWVQKKPDSISARPAFEFLVSE